MEALNAAGLTPISVLSDRKGESRKLSSLPQNFAFKFPNPTSLSSTSSNIQESVSWGFHGGLLLATSVLNTGFAKALTYEEALQRSLSSFTSEGGLEFGASGILDNAISFATENPAVIAGGAALLAVPLVLSQLLQKPKPWGVDTARNAYAKLADDADAQLLDIRAPVEFRRVGGPDVRGLGKKPVSIAYKGDDKPGFLKKLSLKFKEPGKTTLFILDKFNGNSELVAELVTVNGFKAAYAIKDGAEGPRGWLNSNLPWRPPKKALSLDFGDLTDAISGAVGDNSDGLPVTLGVAAAAGLGLLAFSEVETILQLLGSAAIVQLVSKKFLFAEDRKATLKQVDEFLDTKVAPKDLVDEITQIGKAFLPSTGSSKALPAPAETAAETNSPPASPQSTVQKFEAPSESVPEPKVEAAEPAIQINSVPREEVKAESLPRPLSPYPYYPDLKPPTSPTPAQP